MLVLGGRVLSACMFAFLSRCGEHPGRGTGCIQLKYLTLGTHSLDTLVSNGLLGPGVDESPGRPRTGTGHHLLFD